MSKKSLKDSGLDINLSKADLENILTIYNDKNNNIVFNLNETIYINSGNNLEVMMINHPIHWSTLSYNLYGTPRLAWLLLKVNGISIKNMFNKIDPKIPIMYINKSDIITIINQINN